MPQPLYTPPRGGQRSGTSGQHHEHAHEHQRLDHEHATALHQAALRSTACIHMPAHDRGGGALRADDFGEGGAGVRAAPLLSIRKPFSRTEKKSKGKSAIRKNLETGHSHPPLFAEHRPQGPTEEHLVKELARILWRKRRLLGAA